VFRKKLALLILTGAGLAGAWRAQTAPKHTLRQALAESGLTADENVVKNLDQPITSGAVLDDAEQFVISYFVDDGTSHLNPPLFLNRYDRKRKEWKSATLGDARAKWQDMDVDCLGSILSITAAGQALYLDTHINPSAGCLLVVSKDLKLQASLYGWLLSRLGDDQLLYQRSEIHFAPVHPAEIAVYDFRTQRDWTIFPAKPDQPVRKARTEQLRRFYEAHPDWCNQNNDPCDPEYFDSFLDGEVVTNSSDRSLAFVVSYKQEQMARGDVQKPSGPEKVVYVYRNVDDSKKMEYREMLMSDVKARFGDAPLKKLLEPETIEKIFSASPPKESRP
jgi:hypothetical protein